MFGISVLAWITAAALLLATPLTLHAASPEPTAQPLLAPAEPPAPAGAFAGPGWIGLAARLDGSSVSVKLTTTTHGALFSSLNIYDANDTFLNQLALYTAENENGLYENQTLASGANLSVQIAPPTGSTNTPGYVNFTGPAGTTATFKLLFWLAGGVDAWNYTTTTTPGTILLGNDSGPDAYLFQAKDLQGGSNLRAYPLGVGARAEYDTTRSLPVHDALIGLYGDEATNDDILSLTTPADERACPCAFNNATGPNALGPGTYTLHLTGLGAGASGLADIVFSAADARLP